MMNPSEKNMESKREEEEGDDHEVKSKLLMTPSSSSSSRHWTSSLKNPRIVRVSRSHGGKDRHSKVCTVRGLRDRRIRLSVQTAIQLYDLQERLGLSQPSKVIDWLMDATQHEIDKLPPLPSNFFHSYFHDQQQYSADHNMTSTMSNIQPDQSYMDHHPLLSPNLYKNGSSQNHDHDEESGLGGFVAQVSAHNFFPLNSQFSAPNMAYNSNYFQLETAPNLSLSQFGGGFSFSDENDQQHMRTSAAAAATYTPIFPPSSLENDQFGRQINHSVLMPAATLHLINSSSSPIKSFSFNPSLHRKEDEQH